MSVVTKTLLPMDVQVDTIFIIKKNESKSEYLKCYCENHFSSGVRINYSCYSAIDGIRDSFVVVESLERPRNDPTLDGIGARYPAKDECFADRSTWESLCNW